MTVAKHKMDRIDLNHDVKKLSTLLSLCAGKTFSCDYPHKGQVVWSSEIFFYACINELMNKMYGSWRAEIPECLFDVIAMGTLSLQFFFLGAGFNISK